MFTGHSVTENRTGYVSQCPGLILSPVESLNNKNIVQPTSLAGSDQTLDSFVEDSHSSDMSMRLLISEAGRHSSIFFSYHYF